MAPHLLAFLLSYQPSCQIASHENVLGEGSVRKDAGRDHELLLSWVRKEKKVIKNGGFVIIRP
jgi:hypothetical protein